MDIQLPRKKCTGCGACVGLCPVNAISMVESDDDGFLYPIIDQGKCVKCGMCMQSCHALAMPESREVLDCYAAQTNDSEILYRSTSGGLFSALATAIFDMQGVVYGCTWSENYTAEISRAESINQIAPMHGSKYVWSSSAESYPKVKQDLEAGRSVLYTCLPCQAAGLKKYLKRDYDNLYIVDILCGGAPSPFAFRRYLETISSQQGLSELHFQFRDKEKYGSGVHCTYFKEGKKHNENYLENSFYFSFCSKSRVSWRNSCYQCDYKSIQRVSDLSIGDYWGVESHHSEFDPKEGVSLVLVNSTKGMRLFEMIKNSIKYLESDVDFAYARNSLVKKKDEGHVQIPKERDAFFRTLKENGWKAADKKYLSLRKKMMLHQKIQRLYRRLSRLIKKCG